MRRAFRRGTGTGTGAGTERCRAGLGPAVLLGLMIALSFAFAGTGCRVSRPEHGHKLGWRTLSRGLTSGLTTPTRRVIRDEGEWYRFWAEHASDVNRIALPPPVTFPEEMVVAVAMGERPTGGYQVDVVDAELRGSTLRLLVGERTPRPGTFQIQQTTQPFIFVAFPAVKGSVSFKTVAESALPKAQGPGGNPGRPSASGTRRAASGSGLRPRTEPAESPRGASTRPR